MELEDIDKVAKRVLELKHQEVFEQNPKRCKDEDLKKVAKLAIEEMMTAWGIDVKNPLEMQEDFAWTRKYRRLAERTGGVIVGFIAISLIGGLIGLIVKSIWGEK